MKTKLIQLVAIGLVIAACNQNKNIPKENAGSTIANDYEFIGGYPTPATITQD